MECHDARPLIPGYLDGELSEAQAAPLRGHLLRCSSCRGSAQDGKALKAWFVGEGPVEIPAGFAARVARRAFAGDRGETVSASGSGAAAAQGEGRLLSFVLQLTAVAAAVLMALSIAMRSVELPESRELFADDASKAWTLQELDRLNRVDEEADEPELGGRSEESEEGE